MVMMQRLRKSSLCLALVIFSLIIMSDTYSWIEAKQGTSEPKALRDTQSAFLEETIQQPKAELQQEESIELYYIPEIPLDKELQKYTYDLCLEKNIDYELVLAVMWRESRFEFDATGYNANGTQDSGIMQINDINKEWIAKELDITDLYDPYQNILAGITMLADFINTYGEHDGLMSYGAGAVGMTRLKNKGFTTLDSVQLALDKRKEIELMEKTK